MTKAIIFTDGSCYGNGKNNAVAGYGIHFLMKGFNDISEPLIKKPFTNQRAELMAIYVAIKIVLKYEQTNIPFEQITIYSDSNYSIKSLTEWGAKWENNQWNTSNGSVVKNIDIIKPMYLLYKKHKNRIILTHVYAHTGKSDLLSKHNAIADELANDGTKKAIALMSSTSTSKPRTSKPRISNTKTLKALTLKTRNKISSKKISSKKIISNKHRILKINFTNDNK